MIGAQARATQEAANETNQNTKLWIAGTVGVVGVGVAVGLVVYFATKKKN